MGMSGKWKLAIAASLAAALLLGGCMNQNKCVCGDPVDPGTPSKTESKQ
jgi:hypothetical protein